MQAVTIDFHIFCETRSRLLSFRVSIGRREGSTIGFEFARGLQAKQPTQRAGIPHTSPDTPANSSSAREDYE
jgi:hypothetical protein